MSHAAKWSAADGIGRESASQNESLRLEILQEITDKLDQLQDTISSIQNAIDECRNDPDRWPPYSPGTIVTTDQISKLLSRYHNIVDLRRMPNDHGDAAVRRALEKVGFRFFSGQSKDWTYYRMGKTIDFGYPDTIDGKENLSLHNFIVTYHGEHYGDTLWTLTNPTAGEVLEKLGLELPFE